MPPTLCPETSVIDVLRDPAVVEEGLPLARDAFDPHHPVMYGQTPRFTQVHHCSSEYEAPW